MSVAIWCGEYELSGHGEPEGVTPYAAQPRARLLVRLHGEPIGYVTVDAPNGAPLPETVRRELPETVWRELSAPIREHLRAEGLDVAYGKRPPKTTPRCPDLRVPGGPVSVVVCTRDRAALLEPCLRRLSGLAYPDAEIIIVDNAPADGSTRAVTDRWRERDPRFRYEREDRPGLSHARNRGLAAAGGTYVAYTDDDVSADPYWLHGIVKGFRRRPDVRCVTGLVGTADVTNSSEAYFDARNASWSSRCAPRLFDLRSERDALYPYSAGVFGTGASFAFLRGELTGLGGFDTALGAGTLARGGEDLDIFVRVLRSGGAIAYEPSALVWHHHRADPESLSRQMFGYGAGLTAYLTKLLLDPATGRDVLSRVPHGLVRMARIRRGTTERLSVPAPRRLLGREVAGYLAGPVLYARSRRRAAR